MDRDRAQWLFYAIASGGCAALNGAFAKLTTTQLTSSWATSISHAFGKQDESMVVEYLIRGVRLGSFAQESSSKTNSRSSPSSP